MFDTYQHALGVLLILSAVPPLLALCWYADRYIEHRNSPAERLKRRRRNRRR